MHRPYITSGPETALCNVAQRSIGVAYIYAPRGGCRCGGGRTGRKGNTVGEVNNAAVAATAPSVLYNASLSLSLSLSLSSAVRTLCNRPAQCSGYNDYVSASIRLLFDRATTIRRPTLRPLAYLCQWGGGAALRPK